MAVKYIWGDYRVYDYRVSSSKKKYLLYLIEEESTDRFTSLVVMID